MRKLILLFVLCFSISSFSQNNQDIRNINLTTLKLIDDYARYSDVSNKRDKNNLFSVFTSDAIIYNDLVISENFNTEQNYKVYLKEMSKTQSSRRIFYDTDIQTLYLSPIQGSRESGSLDVVLKKNIQAKLTEYQIVINDTLQEYIDYNQTFLLRFSVNYKLDSINDTYNTIITAIKSERDEKKPNIYVFYEKNIGQSPILIAKKKTHLLNTESGEALAIKGSSISYYLTNQTSEFSYNNPSFRKKGKLEEEEGGDFKKFIFNEKITSSIEYNYSIVSNSTILGFNDYYTNNSLSDVQLIFYDAENIIDVLSSSGNRGFSFSAFPFKLKNKSNNISLSLGLKCNLNFSTINFNSDLIDFWYMDSDLDNLSYARHINLSLFNEVVDVNSQSLLLSFKIAYHSNDKVNNNKPTRISPFIGLNLCAVHLASAKYKSSGEGHISGKYPQYFDVEVTDLLNDYGPFSFNSSADLNIEGMLFNIDISELLLGVDFTYKNIGLGVSFNQQIGSLLLFEAIENDMLLTSESEVNSVTDIMSGLELKNNHLSFNLNFKF